MSESSAVSALVYVGIPKPPETSPSWMPPSSLYWIQKSASSISSDAGNRSRAASSDDRAALAVFVLIKNPAPTVPAPRAIVLLRKERRLIKRFLDLVLF